MERLHVDQSLVGDFSGTVGQPDGSTGRLWFFYDGQRWNHNRSPGAQRQLKALMALLTGQAGVAETKVVVDCIDNPKGVAVQPGTGHVFVAGRAGVSPVRGSQKSPVGPIRVVLQGQASGPQRHDIFALEGRHGGFGPDHIPYSVGATNYHRHHQHETPLGGSLVGGGVEIS